MSWSATDEAADSANFMAIRQAVVRAGALMAAAGTGAYRVKEEMNRVGHALGLDDVHAEVTLNTVIATCSHQGQSYTLVGTIPAISVNAGRIAAMEALALNTRPGTSVTVFERQLDAIAAQPPAYGPELTSIAAMIACGSFCFLNHGGWGECLAAAGGAGLGQYLRATLVRWRLNQFAIILLAGLLACLVYTGGTQLLNLLGWPCLRHEAGYTSAVLFLVPGFPLITAGLDLARLDFNAGISRLTYAVLVVMVASLSAWLVAELVQLSPQSANALDLPGWLVLLLRLLASFGGVFGFAIMFNTPVRLALAAASIGLVANTARLYLVDLHWPLQLAAPFASLMVGLLAAWVAPRLCAPRIVLSVPPVLVMIPGATAYQALVYANQDLPLMAMANASQAIFIVVGIAIGLSIARMFTDPAWAFEGRLPGGGKA